MAETPELTILRAQMHEALGGKRIVEVEALQPKCLNVSPDELHAGAVGTTILGVNRIGKWLELVLDNGRCIKLGTGMGADVFHLAPGSEPPGKFQVRVRLHDGSGFTVRYWWFGHFHLVPAHDVAAHKLSANVGPDPLSLEPDEFVAVLRRYPRKAARAVVLDQTALSGIGNAYAHDIMFAARIHPLTRVADLGDDDLVRLHAAVRAVVERAIALGGLEKDFYGKQGNMETWERLFTIGYKKGRPCPECGTPLDALKAGSATAYYCPGCQPAVSQGA